MSKKVIKIALFLICNCKVETMFSVVGFLDVCGVFSCGSFLGDKKIKELLGYNS